MGQVAIIGVNPKGKGRAFLSERTGVISQPPEPPKAGADVGLSKKGKFKLPKFHSEVKTWGVEVIKEWIFDLPAGRSYVSMPVIPADASPDAVFGVDVEVKGYDPVTGWYTPTTLEGGKGYLIRCADPKTSAIHGTNVKGLTWANIKAGLHSGDNLIGIGDKDVTIGDNVEVIGWDAVEDKWVPLGKGDILQRGSGYWIEG